MRVHIRESNVLDKSDKHGGRQGLPAMEQRADAALLQLQFMQSRTIGEYKERMDKSRHHIAHNSASFDIGIFGRVLCI